VLRKTTAIVVTLLFATACGGNHGFIPTAPSELSELTGSTTGPANPGISAVATAAVAASSATITWTTDALSDSRVEYGLTANYGAVSGGATSRVVDHAVRLDGLTPGTSYQFRVSSKDEAGGVATSANHTFTTLGGNAESAGGNNGHEPGRSVAISSPARDADVSGTVAVTATVRGGNVSAVRFTLDDGDVVGEDNDAPYSFRWNTKQTSNGRHTLTAVARSGGQDTASASVRVNVSNSSSSDAGEPDAPRPTPPATTAPPRSGSNSNWPGEPDNFRTLSNQAWNSLTGSGWNYRRRQASKNADVVSDSSAPESGASVLRMIFTTDMDRDSEPGVHWMGLPSRPREIFTGWWMKLSSNWKASPAGGGKIAFLWSTGGQGQVYANIGGSGAPHRININTEWGPYGQKFWEPNVSTTRLNYNAWYRVEWYVRWESRPGAGDGVMRWWVNGTLNGDHRNVRFPSDSGFEQFEFAPTLQNPPSAEQYMYLDHTYVSAP
jgi:Bacterial Ig domain/Purple acid Phosphatase, N-terminal domain